MNHDVTAEEEADHLLALYDGDAPKILAVVQEQFVMLASRAQTLLSLAGITITVTGFSGATIARSGRAAASLLVSGLVVVLVAATFAMSGILRVEWASRMKRASARDAVVRALALRDAKTRAYGRALQLLLVGLALYVSSIALLLLGNLPT
ncbi:MAG: hypothetical protein U0169_00235 [Polyangiaceae bacterium]